jgi:thiamine-phosphate pyrophosphorylase
MKKIKGYYFITDEGLSRAGNDNDVKSALKAGAGIVQYRAKDVCGRQMLLEAKRLRKLCRGALFIVNDRVDIALACGADGVHLGQDDIPCCVAREILGRNKVIGITVRNVNEAKTAVSQGADYVAAAPVFKTGTKKDAGKPVGLNLIMKIKRFARIPVVAIGGINLYNARDVVGAGADALCAISCVVTEKNVAAEIRKFQELFIKQKA